MLPLPRGHASWRRRGRAWRTPLFSIQSISAPFSEQKSSHAFGLIVKKRIGSAVQRNRIKRRLRCVFTHIGKNCDLPRGGWSYILVVRSVDVTTEPFDRLLRTLIAYIQRPKEKGLLSGQKKN